MGTVLLLSVLLAPDYFTATAHLIVTLTGNGNESLCRPINGIMHGCRCIPRGTNSIQLTLWKLVAILAVFLIRAAPLTLAAECGSSSAKTVNLDLWSTRSLSSPNRLWSLISVGSNSSDREAAIFIQNIHTAQKWSIGSIERRGTVFWSEDSKRVFLRDEYAADDTRIRVFDVSGGVPREIKGVDQTIRRAIFNRIPQNETTLWLYYPRVCFAAKDSSMIVLLADAPLVSKTESGPGKPFRLKIRVNLSALQIVK
jgi:hypothetical protein